MDAVINDLMFNQLIVSVISFVVTTLGGAVAGYCIGRIKEHRKQRDKNKEIEKARITIEKATAREMIFEAYDKYVIQKKHLTVDRFREIKETFEAYTLLGGNGTAKKFYAEIEKINPYLVTD